jgi:hypothetical protein
MSKNWNALKRLDVRLAVPRCGLVFTSLSRIEFSFTHARQNNNKNQEKSFRKCSSPAYWPP